MFFLLSTVFNGIQQAHFELLDCLVYCAAQSLKFYRAKKLFVKKYVQKNYKNPDFNFIKTGHWI